MSMITSSTWVPRGFAASFPSKQEFDEDELERIQELAKLQIDDAQEDLEDAKAENGAGTGVGASPKSTKKKKESKKVEADDDDLKEYDLENYDDDEDEDPGEAMGMFANVKSLAYHQSNDKDPYITLEGQKTEEDEEREELQILATDNLVLATKIEDELSTLEVFVYDDESDNLYVHHDIMLPAIPLCVEWLNIGVNKPDVDKDAAANFVAVGTMDPDIEIWDLDIVDGMFPNAILGQGGNPEEQAKPKKTKKKSKKTNDEYHVDAVLALAANRQHRNLLASASADKTVKLWDLHTTKCAKSYSNHTDKVCSLAWHATESSVLLSGSYDRTIVAMDMRAPDSKSQRWGVESDVENVKWDPHDPNFFYVSTENGILHYHDIRNAPSDPTRTKAVWTLQAHDESLSCFDINPLIPGFVATGSTDKTVKLWNIQATGPSMVVSRDFDVGKVFSSTFAPDLEVAFRLAVAGSNGTMHIWDTSTNAGVRKAFGDRVPGIKDGEKEERFVGVVDDDDTDSDSEEGESGEDDGDSDVDSGDAMDED